MDCECIDYRQLPGNNPLFLDFLHNPQRVRSFFSVPAPQLENLRERAPSVQQRTGLPREYLIESLQQFNELLSPSDAMRRSIRNLSDADSVAIVTGQQVGLFGGPSYSLYKAISTIQIAQFLRREGIKAVPVFWLAGDDSDFEEIRTAHFSANGEELAVRYPDIRTNPDQMVGTISLQAVEAPVQQVESLLGRLPFGELACSMLASSYSQEADLSVAFARWMRRLLGEHGLIFFDPSRGAHAQHLSTFYRVVVEKREEIVDQLLSKGAALEVSGYAPQVHVDESETLLFVRRGNNRFKLQWENGRYQCKAGNLKVSVEEMLSRTEADPQCLTQSVLLRPVLQDYIFPTLAYVGGPAEIAYFAQVGAIAKHWGIEPLVIPRVSVTLVDRHSQRFLRTHGITAEELLSESLDAITEQVLYRSQHSALLDDFRLMKDEIEAQLSRIGRKIEDLDKPLGGMLDRSREHMLYHLLKVRSRFITNYRQREPSLNRHLSHLTAHLRPGGVPQERRLNFVQFLAEEGPGLIDKLLDRADPFDYQHTVIRL